MKATIALAAMALACAWALAAEPPPPPPSPPPPPPAAGEGPCTDATPCLVRVVILPTRGALVALGRAAANSRDREIRQCYDAQKAQPNYRQDPNRKWAWRYCVFKKYASADLRALEDAFARSGITNARFDLSLPGTPAKAAQAIAAQERHYGSFVDILNAMDDADADKHKAFENVRDIRSKGMNVVVVLTSLRPFAYGQARRGSGNAVFRVRDLEEAVRGGSGATKHLQMHRMQFIHEVGHIFGANHDRNASPNLPSFYGPCTHKTACAYVNTARRFCTVDAQSNAAGRPGCNLAEGGLHGTGWIEEFSHANNGGNCRSAGYTNDKCGDKDHDNAGLMRARVQRVSALR